MECTSTKRTFTHALVKKLKTPAMDTAEKVEEVWALWGEPTFLDAASSDAVRAVYHIS
jgi:hypothetical protein